MNRWEGYLGEVIEITYLFSYLSDKYLCLFN